jgi:hypothetical protein
LGDNRPQEQSGLERVRFFQEELVKRAKSCRPFETLAAGASLAQNPYLHRGAAEAMSYIAMELQGFVLVEDFIHVDQL